MGLNVPRAPIDLIRNEGKQPALQRWRAKGVNNCKTNVHFVATFAIYTAVYGVVAFVIPYTAPCSASNELDLYRDWRRRTAANEIEIVPLLMPWNGRRTLQGSGVRQLGFGDSWRSVPLVLGNSCPGSVRLQVHCCQSFFFFL